MACRAVLLALHTFVQPHSAFLQVPELAQAPEPALHPIKPMPQPKTAKHSSKDSLKMRRTWTSPNAFAAAAFSGGESLLPNCFPPPGVRNECVMR